MSEAFVPFPKGQFAGSIVEFAFAVLSAAALICVAIRIAWLACNFLLHRSNSYSTSREYIFFHTQLGLYAACLLVGNFLNSLSGLFMAAWSYQGGVRRGNLCTAQGVIMNTGNFAIAFFTVVLAVHTFTSLVLHNRQSAWFGAVVVSVGWFSSIAVGLIPLLLSKNNDPWYGIDGLSCAIRRAYPLGQFLLHLLPIFCASVISAVLYSLIFLVLRRTLIFKGGIKVNFDPQERWNGHIGTSEEYRRFVCSVARSMLWYPFAYVVLLIPYSITGLVDLSGYKVSYTANTFAFCCSFMLGLVNVASLYNTFRILGPAVHGLSSHKKLDAESFGSPEKTIINIPLSLTPAEPTTHKPSKFSSRMSSFMHANSSRNLPSKSRTGSLRQLLPARNVYRSRENSKDSMASTLSDSLQLEITPISDLNHQIIPLPEPVLPQNGIRPFHLVVRDQVQEPLSPHLTPALAPPPRSTRSSILRRSTIETPAASPHQGAWSVVELNSADAHTNPPESVADFHFGLNESRSRNDLVSCSEQLDTSGWREQPLPALVPQRPNTGLNPNASVTAFLPHPPLSPSSPSSLSNYSSSGSPTRHSRAGGW